MAQYSTGTVDVTSGSATVLGVGTAWLAEASVGDWFVGGMSRSAGGGVVYDVAGVVSDTELTLSAPWQGNTLTGQTYALHRDFSPRGFAVVDRQSAQLDALINRNTTRLESLLAILLATGNDPDINFTKPLVMQGHPVEYFRRRAAQITGAQTLGASSDAGEAYIYTGAGDTWTLTDILGSIDTQSLFIEVANVGTGAITWADDGSVTRVGPATTPAPGAATIRYVRNAATATVYAIILNHPVS